MCESRGEKGAQVRRFILEHVDVHPSSIVALTAEQFGISRQMAHRYVRRLMTEGLITAHGRTKGATYASVPLVEEYFTLRVSDGLSENDVWRQRVAPALAMLPNNVIVVCEYGFIEMLNNAIEHSEARKIRVRLRLDAVQVRMEILDQGVGIFEKLRRERRIEDERFAVYELLKGKLTTAPAGHSGQGIFFTSRAFDRFCILSGNTYFSYSREADVRAIELRPREPRAFGTTVVMEIRRDSLVRLQDVFNAYADADIDGFVKTDAVVRLAAYRGENFMSRSQARRLLSRFEDFTQVTLDFEGVEFIGQGFADEVFRVFATAHPSVGLRTANANEDVLKMIRWATARSAR